jgi:6-phosphofructokinase
MFSFCQDCCLIPESPFYLEGEGGLFRYIEKRLKDNGHMVIVVAEGAGQKLIAETIQSIGKDASGNELLLDVGLWLSQKINVRHGYPLVCCLDVALIYNISSCLTSVSLVNSGVLQEKQDDHQSEVHRSGFR